MVLDTGASRTVLDTAALERMDLSQALYETEDEAVGFANNGVSAQLIKFPSLQIGSFSLEHWPLGAINLSHINKTYKTLSIPPVSGILGNDLLVTLQAKIDIGRKQIRVWEPSGKEKPEITDPD